MNLEEVFDVLINYRDEKGQIRFIDKFCSDYLIDILDSEKLH